VVMVVDLQPMPHSVSSMMQRADEARIERCGMDL
jgi:hypothetical protein